MHRRERACKGSPASARSTLTGDAALYRLRLSHALWPVPSLYSFIHLIRHIHRFGRKWQLAKDLATEVAEYAEIDPQMDAAATKSSY